MDYDASLSDLHHRLTTGAVTVRALAQHYLDRIDAIDRNGPALNCVIELNPDALRRSRTRWTPSGTPRGRAGRCTAFRC